MVKEQVNAGVSINPDLHDLRYVKRFLVETADLTNTRVGLRLASLLTERHTEDSQLFTPQTIADAVSANFQMSLSVGGAAGNFS